MAEFRMPALGADMEAGVLVAWSRKPGDVLRRGDVIAEVETDKGIIEVEVFADGVLERYLVEPGQKVPVGTPLAILSEPARPAAEASQPSVAPATLSIMPSVVNVAPVGRPPRPADSIAAPPSIRRMARELGLDPVEALARARRLTRADLEAARMTLEADVPSTLQRVRSSPAARKRAAELGVDLVQLRGTGPQGAIVLADVERAAAAVLQSKAADALGEVEQDRSERTGLRRAIAATMSRSKREIPHYYLTTTIDLGEMMAWLTRYNLERSVRERLLPGALLLKAVARAARELPDFNAIWQDGEVRRMPEVNLGTAIALRGGGLIAPAIHRADTLELPLIMEKLSDLVARARGGALRSSELHDGTLTVTSLGERGVESVLPIIYPPQTAIVGFGRMAERPWVIESKVVVRPLVTATLAADHRVTDGHLGARFLNRVEQLLQTPGAL